MRQGLVLWFMVFGCSAWGTALPTSRGLFRMDLYLPPADRTTSHLSNAYLSNVANQLLEDDTFRYEYDLNGNQTTKIRKADNATETRLYDAENQLIRITFFDTSFVEYKYDGLGRRMAKLFQGQPSDPRSKVFIYDNEDILEERSGTGTLLATFTHGPGIDEPLAMTRSDITSFYHADGLGSRKRCQFAYYHIDPPRVAPVGFSYASSPADRVPGACYHVMNRGDQGEPIFADDRDRTLFLATLAETCQSAGWRIHSFVLMRNHYHLLIETLRATLVRGMQGLNGTYTLRYNRRHHLRGHLFQGRYKAVVVETKTPSYFLTVSDYIHLNPVRARQVRTLPGLLQSPWCSAGWCAGLQTTRPPWFTVDRVLGALGQDRATRTAHQTFRTHLADQWGIPAEDPTWRRLRRAWVWGSEAFRADLGTTLADQHPGFHDPDRWSGAAVAASEEAHGRHLLLVGARRLGHATVTAMVGASRYLLARWVRQHARVTSRWLAAQLGVQTRGGLTNGIYLIGQRLAHEPALRAQWQRLNQPL